MYVYLQKRTDEHHTMCHQHHTTWPGGIAVHLQIVIKFTKGIQQVQAGIAHGAGELDAAKRHIGHWHRLCAWGANRIQ